MPPDAPAKTRDWLFVADTVKVRPIFIVVPLRFKLTAVCCEGQFQIKLEKLPVIRPVGTIFPMFIPVTIQVEFVFQVDVGIRDAAAPLTLCI